MYQKVKSINIKKNLHQQMDKTASQHQMAVTLNLNQLNPPIKRYSQNLMVYPKIHKDSKQRVGEKFTNQMECKNK